MAFIQISAPPNPGPFQWSRKLFHMLGLLIPLLYSLDVFRDWGEFVNPTRSIGFCILVCLTIFVLIVDLSRFKLPQLNLLFERVLGKLLKEEESQQFNAVTPYLISCSFLMFFCSKEVVALGCIFLMIGDPFAAYVGSHYGRLRFWNGKSLEGMFAFVLFAFSVSVLYLWMYAFVDPSGFFRLEDSAGYLNIRLLAVVLCGSIFAAIAEFFSKNAWKGLMDDNLIVPIFGALGIIIFSMVLFPGDMNQFIFTTFELFVEK